MVPMHSLLLLFLAATLPTADGYRGIWYMNQPTKDEFVYKYSGGFATYPQQQSPIAIYSKTANKTFFVYGGVERGKNELLHMVSYYDHKTGLVPRPTILLNKKTDDAHDNPVMSIDEAGHIWVFSNSHGESRPSFIHRSRQPYDITDFELIETSNFSYGHPWYHPGKGFLFLHTLYENKGRSMYWRSSKDGRTWTPPALLARMELGHYQITAHANGKSATAFNMHPTVGGLNARTNLYYLETSDLGQSWQTVRGEKLTPPLTTHQPTALVHDYRAANRLVYLKDINFDAKGRPVILYLTSASFEPGPKGEPRLWHTAHWNGREWVIRDFTRSDHNYDYGSLSIEADGEWRIVAPTAPGPAPQSTGGDMVLWSSRDEGATWQRLKRLTAAPERNHTYARRPVDAHPDFYRLWADGSTLKPSESALFFTDRAGSAVWRLPLNMSAAFARPERIDTPAPAAIEEATIAQIHAALRAGELTCEGLVAHYLRRISAYDKNGPALNAIIRTNPKALAEAAALDRAQKWTGPLHCVPVIVKDNFETAGIPTTNGALAFANYVPREDATQVARLKAAGAIVLAKSSLYEWAFSPYETVNSVLPGYTRNPYATDRVTAGSSGGTAAAVAANFGLVGLGSDTGNSIRGPSSHQALVGMRSTMGLTSRAGVFPLNLLADIAGPMTRTVEDAARVFNVLTGRDERDPVTIDRPAVDYVAALRPDALKGAKIGVLRQAYERETTDPEITAVFDRALADMRRAGATIIEIPRINLPEFPRNAGPCMGFKHDLNAFLAVRADAVPVKDLAAIIASGGFHPNNRGRLESAEKASVNGPDSPACQANRDYREAVRRAVLASMEGMDALVYPTWSNVPRLIGDLNTPHGDNSQFFSPTTGFPALNVPMGFTRGGTLPAGLTILGRPFSEAQLFGLGFSYEQLTHHHRAPSSTPPLY